MINPNVFADLDHLFMINFSVPVEVLKPLVPHWVSLVSKNGRGLPSIVLPKIVNLRSEHFCKPTFNYEFMGLRILVEYTSKNLGRTKGIYFARLIMDPNHVRTLANLMTDFCFESGRIEKTKSTEGCSVIQVYDAQSRKLLYGHVKQVEGRGLPLPVGSVFETPEQALNMYNDIAYGFLPARNGRDMHILQIADPHPNYKAWPLTDLTVHDLEVNLPELPNTVLQQEPCYFVGALPRYWRWHSTERLSEASFPQPATSFA